MSAEKTPDDGGTPGASKGLVDSKFNYLSQGTEKPSNMPNGTGLVSLLEMSARDYDLWLNGYLYGRIHGAFEQRLEDAQVAELAARIAVANVENHADAREVVRQAIRFIDVAEAREIARLRASKSSRPPSAGAPW